MKSKLFVTFSLFVLLTSLCFPSRLTNLQDEKENEIVIGTKTRMYSEILSEWRPLEIYLPDDYDVSDKPYPLLVVLDGGWVFNYGVSIVDMMSPNYLPRMVIVGLPNTNRSRDLYPLSKSPDNTTNGSEKFIQFLQEELFPFLEKNYRTQNYRILFGHSLGGFFSLYTLLKFPSLFDGYIATSPSLSAKENIALLDSFLKSALPQVFNGKFLYFSAGEEEGEPLHQGLFELDQALKKADKTGIQWSFDIFEGEGHVPVKGFYKGLRGLFHRWIPEFEFFRSGTLKDIKNHYGRLTEKYGFTVLPPTPILNVVGGRYLRENEPIKAIELYIYFVTLYPKYASGYLSLAESYIMAKQTELALQNLNKCLELDPENSIAKELLKDIHL